MSDHNREMTPKGTKGKKSQTSNKQPAKQQARKQHRASKALSAASDMGHIVLSYDDNRLASNLFGQYDQHLARIEQKLGIEAIARGNKVTIKGPADLCDQAKYALDSLYHRLETGEEIEQADVDGAIRMAQAADEQLVLPQMMPEDAQGKGKLNFAQIATRKKKLIARTATQDAYIRAMDRADLVFGTGPAGTGKTYLAVAYAASLLERGVVDRIILSRPAVEAGERLGFLPGDMKEKVDPYLRPLYDALYDMMPPDKVERELEAKVIEIAPLAFMRGRTLSNAVVILDEAQNTTSMQMKMFLTRLGENSKMIITGDPSQIDLPSGEQSGLVQAMDILSDIPSIVRVQFTAEDVVRHELVMRIVNAYDDEARRKVRIRRALEERALTDLDESAGKDQSDEAAQ
ncbi:phosphate starvation-inducible protein PhoH [Cohaesibacter gelatinilyticus]|uniref:PhoH-like protein n=2 Tax=Cohaesibacter gelatinilyticus TaxID=372072 RepID=A0A285PF96_9HYPH|nr:phosphate starvation-inducible protein PhoH [Cohaesibacter gelatinilyticus]